MMIFCNFPKMFPVQEKIFLNSLIYCCQMFSSLFPLLHLPFSHFPFLFCLAPSHLLCIHMPSFHSPMNSFLLCSLFLSSALPVSQPLSLSLSTHLKAQPIYHCCNQHNGVVMVATVTLPGHRPGKVTERERGGLAKHWIIPFIKYYKEGWERERQEQEEFISQHSNWKIAWGCRGYSLWLAPFYRYILVHE